MSRLTSIGKFTRKLCFALGVALIGWPTMVLAASVHVTGDVLPDMQRRELANKVTKAAEHVSRYLGISCNFRITINVSGRHRIPMALVPAWRGQRGLFLLPSRAVRQNRPPAVHETTHICAPNGNRMLAEGLAVFLQSRFGDNPAFPNFGRSLEGQLRRISASVSIVSLDSFVTPRPLGGKDKYLAAGSFVHFLITKHGLGKFKKLYALTPFSPGTRIRYSGDRYRKIYRMSLEALEREWRKWAGLP